MRRTMVMALAATALLAGGCSNLSRQQTFVAGGAVLGTVAGAYVAPGATGMIVGAAAGGAGGYLSEMIWRPATPR